ncbi:MAG: Cof-type HAD-IIB family hydrolase [Thermostichales cyanobacterium SZTDM-1c_bins_54]
MSIRLLALDIDGTLAGEDNQVSPAVCQAIQAAQARGVKVAIVTGRMHRSATRFHRTIHADLPLCSYQGALIRDPDTQITYQHQQLPTDLTERLLASYREFPLVVHIYIDDELYVQTPNPLSLAYAERSQVPLHILGDQPLPAPPTKVLAMSEDTALIDQLYHEFRQRYPQEELYLTKSHPTFLEATHPHVNKGQAVQYLAETLLGIPAEQVMAIGDSDNDREMLAYAGIGVAMGNANPQIRQAADWVAPCVEADGVAAAIAHFILS